MHLSTQEKWDAQDKRNQAIEKRNLWTGIMYGVLFSSVIWLSLLIIGYLVYIQIQ